jgi:hypothetical protein
VSFTGHQCDPPDTAIGVLDDGVTGVGEDCKPEGVEVGAVEVELVALGDVVVDAAVVVPGVV